MTEIAAERRKHPRVEPGLPQGLKISATVGAGEARILAAKLVDASESGLGVETYVPLPVGSLVDIQGDLRQTGFSLTLEGQARVVHTRKCPEGVFRIGLAFEEVHYRRPRVVVGSA